MTGNRYGLLVATEHRKYRKTPAGNRQRFVLFECDCGDYKWLVDTAVYSGTKSCGCLKKSLGGPNAKAKRARRKANKKALVTARRLVAKYTERVRQLEKELS